MRWGEESREEEPQKTQSHSHAHSVTLSMCIVRLPNSCDASMCIVRLPNTCDASMCIVRLPNSCDASMCIVRLPNSCDAAMCIWDLVPPQHLSTHISPRGQPPKQSNCTVQTLVHALDGATSFDLGDSSYHVKRYENTIYLWSVNISHD